jgi:hypothetical protein
MCEGSKKNNLTANFQAIFKFDTQKGGLLSGDGALE